MYCRKCKKLYANKASFCIKCGEALVDELNEYGEWLLNGNEQAFELIYNNTKSWVGNYIAMRIPGEEERKDCMQEVYLKLYRNIDKFNPESGSFRAWFNKLLSNQVIDFRRKMRPEDVMDEEDVFEQLQDPTPIAEIQMDQAESARLLREILEVLPDEQRICVVQFYFQGKKRKEIAEMLDVSEETVKRRLKLARATIEENVLALEKDHGTRIYSLTPFIFFLFLGQNSEAEEIASSMEEAFLRVKKEVMPDLDIDGNTLTKQADGKEIAGGSESSEAADVAKQNVPEGGKTADTLKSLESGAVKVAAKTGGKALGIKICAGIAAASVLGGGIFGVYQSTLGREKENAKIEETVPEKTEPEETNEGTEEKEITERDLEKLKNSLDREILKGALSQLPEYESQEDISLETTYEIAEHVIEHKAIDHMDLSQDEAYGASYGKLMDDSTVIAVGDPAYFGIVDGPRVNVVMQKNALDRLFMILGNRYTAQDLISGKDSVSELYIDLIEESDKIVALFKAMEVRSRQPEVSEPEISVSESKDCLQVSYWKKDELSLGEYNDKKKKYYSATLVPADNELGYTITSVKKQEMPVSFGAIAGKYIFSSGAGGWGTEMEIFEDGTFEGEYVDSNPFEPWYVCRFHGKFENLVEVDEYTWSMHMTQLDTERPEGEVYYEDGTECIASGAYGLENADEVLVYLPGKIKGELPYDFTSWVFSLNGVGDNEPIPFIGLYNVNEKLGWEQE